jgi:hypothetical protein
MQAKRYAMPSCVYCPQGGYHPAVSGTWATTQQEHNGPGLNMPSATVQTARGVVTGNGNHRNDPPPHVDGLSNPGVGDRS